VNAGALALVSLKTSLASPVCWADVGSGIGVGVGLARVSQQAQQHIRSGIPMIGAKIIAITASSFILGTSGRAREVIRLVFGVSVLTYCRDL